MAALFDGPGFSGDRIEDDADDDVIVDAQGNGDAEMGDAIEVIHGAVDRVDDPLAAGGLIAADAFFAVEGVARASPEEDAFDEVLGLLVESQFDIVVGGLVDGLGVVKVGLEQFAGFFGGVDGEFEVVHGLE